MQTITNSDSEVNEIYPDIAKDFCCWICKIKVRAQIIDDLKLNTFDIVIVFFFMKNK